MSDFSPIQRLGCGQKPLRTFMVLILLVLCAFLLDWPFRYLTAPWSLTLPGRSSMTGRWAGPVVLNDGVSGMLELDLNYYPTEDISGLNINGLGRYCLNGQTGTFEIYGAADRQGMVDDLRLRPLEDEPLWLAHAVSSRWNGERLTLSGVYSYDPTLAHIARSDVPDPPFEIDLIRSSSDFKCLGGGR